MKQQQPLHIAVAETSAILRAGISSVLRHLPDLHVQTIEVSTNVLLTRCLQGHKPDIVIVNPAFEGWFDAVTCRKEYGVRIVAIPIAITDNSMFKDYDAVISLYDTPEKIKDTLASLMFIKKETQKEESLSVREKDIVVEVVKGHTNKEIADKLFLSVHTVLTHRRNIARKLEIRSPAGLTIYAIVNKLVDISEVKIR